jgi:hypothetical protein
MSVEQKWWNLREPTFESPWWASLVAMAGCTWFGIWELLHGHEATGWAIIGAADVICGLIWLRFIVSGRSAVLLGGRSVPASFEFYQVGSFVVGIIIGLGALATVFFPNARVRFAFDLVRHWHVEGELIAAVALASFYAIARGDARFRPFVLAMLGLDGFGFLCLYLGEIRGLILLPMPLEAVFWILQWVLLCTLFSSMLSLQSRRELDTIAARKAVPYRTFASR